MLAYILKSAITLTLLYSCFFALLSRETLHRFNRCALLTILLASLTLPLIHLTINNPLITLQEKHTFTVGTTPCGRPNAQLPNTLITPNDTQSSTQSSTPNTTTYPIINFQLSIINSIYALGVVLSLAFFLLRIALLINSLRGGLRHTDEYGNTIILRSGKQSPFSIFRFIVMSVDDYETHRREILTHEQAHIRLGHTYDILLLECVKAMQWFNPFIYMLGRDLLTVHEYEADEAVINQGIDATKYQQLLVIKVVGNRLQPFANNLSRSSLKKRITMMHQTKSHGSRALKALLAIPVAAFALYAFATPKTTNEPPFSTVQPSSDATITTTDNTKTKPLVTYRESPKRNCYVVNLCEGVLIDMNGKQHIEERMFNYSFIDNMDGMTSTMQLNGKPFDKNSLPSLTNKDLRKIEVRTNGNHQTVNLITTDVTIPASVKGNLPREMTLLLPGNGEVYSCERRQQPGNWMNCSVGSWEKTAWNWCVKDEFEQPKKKAGFKVYIYANAETPPQDINRAKQMMAELEITNYELVTNVPVRHYTDAELRQWAQEQKAKGTPFDKLYDTMAPNGMTCADVKLQWHIVKAVYGN